MDDQTLHVVAVISNPARYQSRYRLYNEFAAYMSFAENVKLHTVEAAFGIRPFEVTESNNINHLQLRTHSEIWHKENMINLGMAKVLSQHPEAQYIAWIDADVKFARPDFALETIHVLQHAAVCQMWSNSVDLGPNSETIGTARSFCSYYCSGQLPNGSPLKYGYAHTGYAWAARVDALQQLMGAAGGPLLDFAALGSADFYMAWALIGALDKNLYNDVASLPHRAKGFTQNYIEMLFEWQERAKRLNRNLGCVEGTLLHSFHGKKKQRYYNTRENILINNDYDPDTDLRKNWSGLFELVVESARQVKLRDEIRAYFRARNEDSIDTV